MKRNRFAGMVPETPESFHLSVLDALNRMEAERRRRGARQRAFRYAAAAAMIVLTITALLTVSLLNRPVREDAVVSPQESVVEKPKPEEVGNWEYTFETGDCRLTETGAQLEWTIGTSDPSPVLYECRVGFVQDGRCITEYDYSRSASWPQKMGVLAAELLGHATTQQAAHSTVYSWDEPEAGADGTIALIRIEFYRPQAEFFEDPTEQFTDEPRWMLQPLEGGLEARPVNWSGNTEYQTPFGESSMTILEDYEEYICDNPVSGEGEYIARMREYAEIRRLALEIYGYADFLKGYEVRIDLNSGAAQISEVDA